MSQPNRAAQPTNGFADTVGNTPLILLRKLSEATGCKIYGKAEYLNPGLSVKDRAAKFIIEDAEMKGELKPGATIYEATAGNTGVGLLLIGASKGYKCHFVIPDRMGKARIDTLKAMGATVEVVPSVPFHHPDNFTKIAGRRAKEAENGFFSNQFFNIANFQAHYQTTGPEIWSQTEGKIDGFICASGTGGTLGGVSTFLKKKNPQVACWTIDACSHGVKYQKENGKIEFLEKTDEEKKAQPSSILEGIGSGTVYLPLSMAKINGALAGQDQLAVEMAHFLLKNEGGSAALNVIGAVWLAKMLGPGHTIVTILCDGGMGYKELIYNEEWLKEKKLTITRTTAQELADSFNPSFIKVSL